VVPQVLLLQDLHLDLLLDLLVTHLLDHLLILLLTLLQEVHLIHQVTVHLPHLVMHQVDLLVKPRVEVSIQVLFPLMHPVRVNLLAPVLVTLLVTLLLEALQDHQVVLLLTVPVYLHLIAQVIRHQTVPAVFQVIHHQIAQVTNQVDPLVTTHLEVPVTRPVIHLVRDPPPVQVLVHLIAHHWIQALSQAIHLLVPLLYRQVIRQVDLLVNLPAEVSIPAVFPLVRRQLAHTLVQTLRIPQAFLHLIVLLETHLQTLVHRLPLCLQRAPVMHHLLLQVLHHQAAPVIPRAMNPALHPPVALACRLRVIRVLHRLILPAQHQVNHPVEASILVTNRLRIRLRVHIQVPVPLRHPL